ncbi:RNA methyltransferase [Philodulcilactobacillus myokoensis]|uniref:RNA methyltransferase n=1 Tax=Philodulcilactobacillus myokoensis TaxID=2929573 RepID=A0A9W6B1B6_9LACO|nr:class I SAM-dependent RNA methyltransferase [Philodulcilactobacillus myokoensis]GLB46848.1 RNA methyltransferase [Philodulcilactobacillus myokoensis]
MREFKLMATCAAGIEALVGNELRDLGYQVKVENGRVRFHGTIKDIIKCNLWLRTADRIKIIISEFNATTFDQLFNQITSIKWDQWLPMDAAFPMEGKSHQSKLHSVPDVQAIAKKAVVKELSDVYHRRTRLPETGNLYPLEIDLYKNRAMLTMDTTGPSLFKRGYRVAKGPAPIKENMAAALVELTNWNASKPFIDPMCGSGTIPIEAALMGRNIAPGLKRSFTFENWDFVDDKLVQSTKEEAAAKIKNDIHLNIFASDINQNMIDIAKVNAEQANVLHDITFKQVAVNDLNDIHGDNGVVVSNPPYGQRLEDQRATHKLYQQLGKVFRPLHSWSKYFITSDLNFEKYYAQKATKRRKLYNGSLRTDYFQFWGHPIKNNK